MLLDLSFGLLINLECLLFFVITRGLSSSLTLLAMFANHHIGPMISKEFISLIKKKKNCKYRKLITI